MIKIQKNWNKIKKIFGKIHCVSDVLKYKIFKKKTVFRILGIQMAGLAAALSIVGYPAHAFDYNLSQQVSGEVLIPIVITTGSEYEFPIEMTLGMSQPFHAVHPGIDLRAPRGTKIYSMAEGTVVEVGNMLVGYGHFVRIAHKGTVSSLYAHLDQVSVKSGQKVTRGETIGTVGMTGWTTGPHLHFEIHQGNSVVNPLGYISSGNNQVPNSN
jgi:murein DD-endopeptidase MepM/ murein hydrolase activator NlpD